MVSDTTTSEESSLTSGMAEQTKDVPPPANVESSSSESKTVSVEKMVENMTQGFLSEIHPQLQELREKTKEIT